MSLAAVLFGSIGTLAETSELQRQAFNRAFSEAGLPLEWDEPEYRRRLAIVGGRARLRDALGPEVDAALVDALHTTKTEIFHELLREHGNVLRKGCVALIDDLRSNGVRLGIASTTFRRTIDALLDGAGLALNTFDVIVSREDVDRAKPDPQVYVRCLESLGVAPATVVAIEDTAANLQAPIAAGITTVAVPGAFVVEQDFGAAALQVDALTELNTQRLASLVG